LAVLGWQEARTILTVWFVASGYFSRSLGVPSARIVALLRKKPKIYEKGIFFSLGFLSIGLD